jgi:CRISPR/Cas system-associated exonuclease Cas4 (RecB family)
MGHDLYLSYSGRRAYLICPKQYWYSYELVDKTRLDVQKSFFGQVIGTVFEWFYEKRVWAMSNVMASTVAMIEPAFTMVLQKENFDPASDPYIIGSIREDLHTYVPKGVEVIRTHELLTDNSRAEVDLTVVYEDQKTGLTVKMGGRSDFVHGYRDVWILDGKGSAHREKYVDSQQVIWYALLHYLRFRVAPSRIGFIHWKFPEDPLQWVDYNSQSLRDCVNQTFEVAQKIMDKAFRPTPSPDCGGCNYRQKCEEGIKDLTARKIEDDGRFDDSIFGVERLS